MLAFFTKNAYIYKHMNVQKDFFESMNVLQKSYIIQGSLTLAVSRQDLHFSQKILFDCQWGLLGSTCDLVYTMAVINACASRTDGTAVWCLDMRKGW